MTCRYCGFCLDGEDIYTALAKHEFYADKDPQAIEVAARMYGWTQENKKCFQKDCIIQFTEKHREQIMICPECCGVDPRKNDMPKQYYNPTTNKIMTTPINRPITSFSDN